MSSSSSSSSEDEKANICLVAENDVESCSSSEVSSCASLNEQNYSELLEVFQETHDEANRLVLSNNRLKDLNSWLEKKVKSLEEELEKAKSDFEKLENLFWYYSFCLLFWLTELLNQLVPEINSF